MRVMLLAIVPAVNSGGDVAYLLQCRFYLHKVVDVELHGIAVLLPHVQRAACRPFAFFGQVSVTPLPLCRLFAFVGNRSGRLFRHLFSLAGLGRFLGRLFEVGEVRGEIHGVADSLCSGMDCLLEITV